jgi:malic enzyme
MLYNFKKVWNFFENLGYARAVAHLARQGFYKETEALVFDMKEKANIKLKRIEEDELDIPVFHDDQHGTAIIIAATLINALDISRKSIKKIAMWIKNKIQAFNESSIFLLQAIKNKELQKKIWNFFEDFGYARAVTHLTRLGFYKETETLMLDMKEKANIKLKRIEKVNKLERMKEIKLSYNPLGHYLSLVFSPFIIIDFKE